MKKFFRSPIIGLPLLYFGVLLMVIHFVFHLSSNLLLTLALTLEIVGVVAHYYKIKH